MFNKGSGWNVESIGSQYINNSTYRPLSGSSYIGLTNIKNKGQKCFLQCHVRYINSSKEHPERIGKIEKKIAKNITNPEEITEEDKEFISNLDYDGIEFPLQVKRF